MKTLKQKIEVMQAAASGARIQMKSYGLPDSYWTPAPFECPWNWSKFDYRIAEPEIAPGHNPDSLTVDQVETHLGWRLLDEDEINAFCGDRRPVIQQWTTTGWQPGNGAFKTSTYRTKLSHKELAEHSKPKPRLPLGPEDFPPGSVFWLRHIGWNPGTRTMITFIGKEKIRYSTSENGFGERTYTSLAEADYEYSLDGGKTWLPCYREQ